MSFLGIYYSNKEGGLETSVLPPYAPKLVGSLLDLWYGRKR